MLPNIAKLQPMLERMTGPQLQQFAAMHHDDAVAVGLAMQIDKNRKKEVARLQGLMSGQKQPTVVDQAMQALGNPQQPMQGGPQGGAPMPPPGGPQGQMPPQGMPPQGPPGMQMPPQAPPAPQGLAGLPAPNMEGMADGGIAGYADEDEAVGYADGGVVHMAGGGFNEDAIRKQLSSLGTPQPLIDLAVERERAAANMPQTQVPYTSAIPSAVAKDNMVVRDTTSMFRDPGYDVFKNPPTIRQLHGLPVDPEATSPFGQALKSASQGIGQGLKSIGRGLQGAVDYVRDVGDPLKNPRELEARRLEQAAKADPGFFEALTPTQRAQREAEAANIRSSFPMADYSNEGRGKVPMMPNQGMPQAEEDKAGLAALAARKSAPPQPPATPRTGASTGSTAPQPPAAPAYTDRPVSSYIPIGSNTGMTPEEAREVALPFSSSGMFAEGSRALLQSGKARDERLRELQKTAPDTEIGKKAEEYIKSQREELAAEKKDRGAQFLISAGLAIASGTSRNAMQNIAQGLQVGVKDAKDAMKDFKAAQKELTRMEADLENARIAQKERRFDRMFSFEESAAAREERRQEYTFNGLMKVTGDNQQAALGIYNASQQRANDWSLLGANMGYGRDERLSGQAFKSSERRASEAFGATEGAKDRANRLAAASIDKEGDRIRALGGGDLLAGYKVYKEITGKDFSLPEAYADYMSKWKPNPMNPADRMLSGQEFAAQMGSLYTTTKPPADATILKRP
jgi:hypothetical protein